MQVAAAESANRRNISLSMHTLSPDTSLAGQVQCSFLLLAPHSQPSYMRVALIDPVTKAYKWRGNQKAPPWMSAVFQGEAPIHASLHNVQ